MSRAAKEMTPEEIEILKEYRREQRRAYWARMTPEERRERNRKSYKAFWDSMTPEQRKAKRAEYDLNRAKNRAARAAAQAAPDAE